MYEEKRCIVLNIHQYRELMGILYQHLLSQQRFAGPIPNTFMGIPLDWEVLPVYKEDEQYTSKW
jgi:hypothetical protein